MSKLVSVRKGKAYSVADIVGAFSPIERKRKIDRVEGSSEVANSTDVRSALKHLASVPVPGSKDRETYVDDRAEWIKCGLALKREYGDDGFSIWEDWSKLSRKYDEDSCHAAWQSFDVNTRQGEGAVRVASIFKAALDAGWRDSSFLDRWLGGNRGKAVPFTPSPLQKVTLRKRVWIDEVQD